VKDWRTELAYERQAKIAAWGLKVRLPLHEAFARLTLFTDQQEPGLQARVLPPPRVLYANDIDARASDGAWNLRGKRVSPLPLELLGGLNGTSSSGKARNRSKHGRSSPSNGSAIPTRCSGTSGSSARLSRTTESSLRTVNQPPSGRLIAAGESTQCATDRGEEDFFRRQVCSSANFDRPPGRCVYRFVKDESADRSRVAWLYEQMKRRHSRTSRVRLQDTS